MKVLTIIIFGILVILILGYSSNVYLKFNPAILESNDEEMRGQGISEFGFTDEYFVGIPFVIHHSIAKRNAGTISVLSTDARIWFFRYPIMKISSGFYAPSP